MFTDWLLYLSSYVVAFLALALRFTSPAWLRPICILFAMLGVLSTAYILYSQRQRSWEPAIICEIDDRGSDVGGYAASYLLPIVVVGEPSLQDLLAYFLVIIVMGIIYVRSTMMQINPTLYVLGYRLFYITTNDGFSGYLITRRKHRKGDSLKIVRRGSIAFDQGVSSG